MPLFLIQNPKLKTAAWIIVLLALCAFAALNALAPLPAAVRTVNPLLLAIAFCIVRFWAGPAAGDRVVVLHVFGIVLVSFCAVLMLVTDSPFYIDVALAWVLQTFIMSLLSAKYIEGKNFGD